MPTPAMPTPAMGNPTMPAGTRGMENYRSFIFAFNVCRGSAHFHHHTRVGIHRFVAPSLLPVEEDLSKHCSLLCTIFIIRFHKRWFHHLSLGVSFHCLLDCPKSWYKVLNKVYYLCLLRKHAYYLCTRLNISKNVMLEIHIMMKPQHEFDLLETTCIISIHISLSVPYMHQPVLLCPVLVIIIIKFLRFSPSYVIPSTCLSGVYLCQPRHHFFLFPVILSVLKS
jgi:hypothetical protein